MRKSSKLNNVKSVSLAFTMHSLLKLLQQQTIFVLASSWLDVNSVFNSLLFILYVTSLESNKTFPFNFECLRSCWMYFAKSVNEFSFVLCVFKLLFTGFTLGHFWEFSQIWALMLPSVSDLIYISCCFKKNSWLLL